MSTPAPVRHSRRAPLSVRLNDREYEILRQRANGLPLSSYLKQAALGESAPVIRRRLPPTRDQNLLANILAALGQSRLPGNVNQLAKAVHSGSLPVNAQTQADIAQACGDILIIRKALLMALGVESDQEPPRVAAAFNAASEPRP